MMKKAVIYNSKYGATKKYAEWIANNLEADLFNGKTTKPSVLSDYDMIIFGSGIYGGGLYNLDFLRKNIRKSLSGKIIVCFGVGIAVAHDENQIQADELNFKDDLKGIPCFYFTGRFDPKSLKVVDKGLIWMVKKMIAGGTGANAEELQDYFTNGCDLIDAVQVAPLIDYVHELEERRSE